jgi:hypothetical protein
MKKLLLILIILAATVSLSIAADKDMGKIKRVDSLIAVFDLEVVGKVDKDIARPLSDSVRREIMQSGKYEIIDRSNMDKILKEQSFQMTGCTQKDCAVEAGQLLGVGKIVVGTVSLVGQTYYLSLSIMNVESGKTEKVEEETCRCEIDELINLSKRVAGRLMGQNNDMAGKQQDCSIAAKLSDEANYLISKNPLAASNKLREAIGLCGNNSALYYNFAMSLYSQGKYDETKAALDRAIAIKTNYAKAMNALAFISYKHGGDMSRAKILAKKAVEIEPSNRQYIDTLNLVTGY